MIRAGVRKNLYILLVLSCDGHHRNLDRVGLVSQLAANPFIADVGHSE